MGSGGAPPDQVVFDCPSAAVAEPDSMLLPGHDVPLGRFTTVRRLLPQKQRRMVGAWCFVDQFGPDEVGGRPGMQVPPHPHSGLQTVTWLVDGEIAHRDSLGNEQTIRPGQLNLMTAGHGIAHSEESPPDHPPGMHGLQLWVALPDHARHRPAGFEHHRSLPSLRSGDAELTLVIGELDGVRSPASAYTPLVGAQVRFERSGRAVLSLRREFEYAVLVLAGGADVAQSALTPGSLLYLGRGRTELPITADAAATLFVFGGEPFEEPLMMWWNFAGRSHEEIVQARTDWMAGRRFGTVTGPTADPLPAPEMPRVTLKARDRHGHVVG